jgi:hypothetical protein
MMAGCYLLDLYCDTPGCENASCSGTEATGGRCSPGEFYAETGAQARSQARKAGWKLNLQTGHVLCPTCAAMHNRRTP